MRKQHVFIVGGGASGLVAAIMAARHGAEVTIIEQKDRVGKKILSTGNGRCNLTNAYMTEDCFRSDDMELVKSVIDQFGYQDTCRFFEELGVLLKDRQGYIYPISDQATTILDVLRMEIERLQVTVELEQSVTQIQKTKCGFLLETQLKRFEADKVILATGGKASPVLGSDGSGYSLAKMLGHSLSPVVPALVQLKAKGNFFKQLAGVRTQATIQLFVDHRITAEDTGELQLTNYGVSGIPVFQISRYAAKALHRKQSVSVQINFLPGMSRFELKELFIKRVEKHGQKTMEDFCVGMFHKKIIGVLLKECGINLHTYAYKLTEDQWNRLLKSIQEFEVEIEGTNSFEQAQVCAGGVRTTEVSKDTMESLYVPGLYLTGELLDVDGICGGYNLQWAWATGFLAGSNAAKGEL